MSSGTNKGSNSAVLIGAGAILIGGALLSLFLGATQGYDPQIFWMLRAPRTVSAIAVGGGLAVAGALIQASLGNPLAEPYTVGIASAAALGAVIGSVGGTLFGRVAPGTPLFGTPQLLSSGILAFVFALGGLSGLALWLRRSFHHAVEVLLAGVVASFFFTALATLIMALADPAAWPSAMTWIMGSLGRLTLSESVAALFIMLFVSAMGWLHWKPLDLISVDELTAQTAGVDVAMFRRRLFVLVAIITAISVSIAGIIGFVGLIVPHLLRRLGVRGHFTLIPAVFLLGAGLLLCSDVLARVVVRPSELPVGVIMAIIGAPFFLALARRQERI